jgi:acetyl-CoA synthetase
LATNIPGSSSMKPGSCGKPHFGVDFIVVNPTTGQEVTQSADGKEDIEGVLCLRSPTPSIARSVYGDHERYMNVYLKPYAGYYFTGDACRKDKDGYYYITGRVDDVINPSGHRLGTAELEAVLTTCPEVSEAAVVGFPHDIKGEGIGVYVILKENAQPSAELSQSLKNAIRAAVGPIATPDFIIFSDLPKTRSGKIMRRILRKVAAGVSDVAELGDLSTLADPSIVPALITKFQALKM